MNQVDSLTNVKVPDTNLEIELDTYPSLTGRHIDIEY